MAKAGNFEYVLRIGFKKAYVLVENIKSSDEISVIIWIEIQIFLTVSKVLKNPLCLGGPYIWQDYYYYCRIMGSRGLLKSFLLLVLFSFVMTFFVFLLLHSCLILSKANLWFNRILKNQTWLLVKFVWKFSMRTELTTNTDQWFLSRCSLPWILNN